MSKFMILFKSTVSAAEQMQNATPEEMKAGMQAWMTWKDNLPTAISFEWGLPLQSVNEVTASEVQEGHSTVSGYAIMEGDKTAITEILTSHPHLVMSGSSIDVLEMLSMSGK